MPLSAMEALPLYPSDFVRDVHNLPKEWVRPLGLYVFPPLCLFPSALSSQQIDVATHKWTAKPTRSRR